MKCSGDNVILRGIVHVVSGFPLHFMFYRGNLDCFSNMVVFLLLMPYIQKYVIFYILCTNEREWNFYLDNVEQETVI